MPNDVCSGRVAVELVQHDLGLEIAADLDDDAHAVAVGFVAQVGDALDALVADGIGDDLDHPRLVDLIGDLVDDDRHPILADLLDVDPRAHGHGAAAGLVGADDATPPEDDRAGREVGTEDVRLDQLADGDGRVVDDGTGGAHHLAEVVRRNVGRHADGDAAGAVDEEIWIAGRQNLRFKRRVVVIRLIIDGVLVDVLGQRLRRLGQPRLGVPHGRRPVAVHRAKVALALNQRQTHGEALRHADERVVDRLVAVRMIFAHHVTDDARGFAERLVGAVAALVHGVDDASLDRLEAVADIRQRPADDHAHGVIEVRALHLVFDGYGRDVGTGWNARRRHGRG